MKQELVQYNLKGSIAYVTISRSERYNALNIQLIEELIEVMLHCDRTNEVRVVVVNGEGKAFCAGADIQWMKASAEAGNEQNEKDSRILAELFYEIHHLSKPVIAAVHGPVYGGGIGLMAACDLVVADASAKFKFSEVLLGITPSTIMPHIVYRTGKQAAKLKVLTAELFDAKEANRINLVDEVVEENAIGKATEIAETMLLASPEALAETKALIDQMNHSLDATLIDFTVESLMKMKKTENAKEGLQAFLEKRKPIWK